MKTPSLRKHPWLLIAPLLLLFITLIGLEIVQAQGLVGGNDVIDRPVVDTYDNFSMIDTHNPINMDGQVTAFEVFVGTTEPVTLVIYRQTGPGPDFSIVGTSEQKTPTSVGFNQFQLTTPIQVQAGDLVGLVNSSVKFTMDPPHNPDFGDLSGTMLFSSNGAGLTTNFIGSSNRTYSVRVIGEGTDNDGDGISDDVDTDDDNDGQLDEDELACGSDPLDAASLSPDNDGDNSPDCVDPDDDNDGVADDVDAFPFSDMSATVMVGDCDSGVASQVLANGA
ncbi:MAG: hypothetical protein D6711_03080, partial [Chloroflexi bacterium]